MFIVNSSSINSNVENFDNIKDDKMINDSGSGYEEFLIT
jgi:hypothetical protein